ncbi:MAG TPA: DEAD/DEAH box helicase [Thermodesulfobacteriota bacterium]
MKFEEFVLSNSVNRAIRDMGFSIPTPIQEESIPHALSGRDIIGQAQTGTGKTLAFGIPLVEKVDPLKREVQAIVLTPTRELAVQVAGELGKIGKHKQITVIPVYGGQPIGKQLAHLKEGVHIVVGTPGRVIDHLKRRALNLKSVCFTVLDEADRMLDMGFINDMKFILAQIPVRCQIMLFSATVPSEISWLAKRYMKDPIEIIVSKDTLTVPQTKQMFFEVREFGKLGVLSKLIESGRGGVFLVFRRTKAGVDDLTAALKARGYNAQALHGNCSQRERDRVMRLFRRGEVAIVVATDVAARGLDINGITHVVNYDIPQDVESYVHRIGRTGRSGRAGVAITFVTHWEYGELKRIQAFSKAKIDKVSIPTNDEGYARLSN